MFNLNFTENFILWPLYSNFNLHWDALVQYSFIIISKNAAIAYFLFTLTINGLIESCICFQKFGEKKIREKKTKIEAIIRIVANLYIYFQLMAYFVVFHFPKFYFWKSPWKRRKKNVKQKWEMLTKKNLDGSFYSSRKRNGQTVNENCTNKRSC